MTSIDCSLRRLERRPNHKALIRFVDMCLRRGINLKPWWKRIKALRDGIALREVHDS